MSTLSDLKTTYENIVTQLKDMTANPKPTYTIDGQTVRWDEHFKVLTEALETVTKQIAAEEPFEERWIGWPTA